MICAECERRVYAGMYVFLVGDKVFCQGCVRQHLVLDRTDGPSLTW